MACAHPLLDVDNIHDASDLFLDLLRDFFVGLRLLGAFQVAPEVLKQGHLLLEVLWIVGQRVFQADVLAVGAAALHVVEVEAIRVQNDFCGVVEEDTGGLVA